MDAFARWPPRQGGASPHKHESIFRKTSSIMNGAKEFDTSQTSVPKNIPTLSSLLLCLCGLPLFPFVRPGIQKTQLFFPSYKNTVAFLKARLFGRFGSAWKYVNPV